MARFKSLKVTRWSRFRAFLRGVLLYNTVYWRRASDGVDRNASRVGRTERERSRPQVDPELLRPRARAGGELLKAALEERLTPVTAPPPVHRPRPEEPPSPPPPPPRRLAASVGGEGVFGTHFPDAADEALERERHSQRRRRVVRRRELMDKAVDPSRILRARAEGKPKRAMPGWLRWLIGWHR